MSSATEFSMAFIIPYLEIHLSTYDASGEVIAVGFMLLATSYMFFSIFGTYLFNKLDPRVTMLIGINIMGLAYLMLIP